MISTKPRRLNFCVFYSLFLVFLFGIFQKGYAQSGILYNSYEAKNGFVLFYHKTNNTAYLVNNCGEVVNQWNNIWGMDLHPKLLSNGNLLYMDSNIIRELDWNNNIVSEVYLQNLAFDFVYEVIKMSNGHYLCAARDLISENETIALGFDTDVIFPTQVDAIIEIDNETGGIVWAWNIKDHLIQERDENVGNYGIVAEHPELLNIDAISSLDFQVGEAFMINSFDYNSQLDQILISLRKMSEIIIIDHSTTTEEAAGHTGGNLGKGGDVVYRWGNPQNYGRGTEEDQFLYYQHNPQWITTGPYFGKILCYNNGLSRPGAYSDVPIINPSFNGVEYTLPDNAPFGPETPQVVYSGDGIVPFYSSYLSGAQPISNGNIFITQGQGGRLIELNSAGELVWEYKMSNTSPYRTEKYNANFPAFEGKDMLPIETDLPSTSDYECEIFLTNTVNLTLTDQFDIIQSSPTLIQVNNTKDSNFSIELYNSIGSLHKTYERCQYNQQVQLHQLKAGMYILQVKDSQTEQIQVHKFIIY